MQRHKFATIGKPDRQVGFSAMCPDPEGSWVDADEAEARIRELEAERDAAHAKGVREGEVKALAEMVRKQWPHTGMDIDDVVIEEACGRAIDAANAEQAKEATDG